MEASNQSHRFVHEKYDIHVGDIFLGMRPESQLCGHSRAPALFAALRNSRICEESSETVDLFLKNALFLNFYFFRSELCGSEALQKYASVAASRLRSRKKVESIFSTINEFEGIAIPCL